MNRREYLLIAFAVLGLIGLFYWFGYQSQQPKYDWAEDGWKRAAYSEKSDQPYGAQVFRNMLDNYFPGQPVKEIRKKLTEDLPLPQQGKGTYVFTGAGMYLDSADTQHLLKFVEDGNTALIIGKTIPFDLMNLIYYEECEYELGWNDYSMTQLESVALRLLQPIGQADTEVFYADQNQPRSYRWAYLPPHVFCPQLPQRPLGVLEDSMINFAVFPHGYGRFLIHTTPIAFSNFHLLRPEARAYAAGVLSHLKEGPIWWDAFSRVPEAVAQRHNDRFSARELPEEHALTYILKQEPLAWAWYLLLGLAGAYLLFRSRRKQRPVPVLPVNENSSYEFINTIAHLHFREKNYRGICVQAMRLFLTQVREKYGLAAALDPENLRPRADEGFYLKLAQRSEIPETDIRALLQQYEGILQFQPQEQHMIDFYLSLENFWKKAK